MDQHPSESSAIYSVFHPTDFSDASMLAFAHALKIALSIQGKLDILHVDTQNQADWEDFPGVRQMLERWGSIPPKSDRQAVIDLDCRLCQRDKRGFDCHGNRWKGWFFRRPARFAFRTGTATCALPPLDHPSGLSTRSLKDLRH